MAMLSCTLWTFKQQFALRFAEFLRWRNTPVDAMILGIIKAHHNIVKTRPSNVNCGNTNVIAIGPTRAWPVQRSSQIYYSFHFYFWFLLISWNVLELSISDDKHTVFTLRSCLWHGNAVSIMIGILLLYMLQSFVTELVLLLGADEENMEFKRLLAIFSVLAISSGEHVWKLLSL